MKKKFIFISVIILTILIIFLLITNVKNKNIIKIDGVKYALTLNNVSTNIVPSKGNYNVNISCNNADGKWDYENWKLKIFNITGNVSCNVAFTTINTTTNKLNDYLISLVGTNQGTGSLVNENGYRYEGKNPNNYLWFNNEMWRIIGVFGNEVHGQSDNLVKIIRNEPTGTLVWNPSTNVTWETSSLKSLLNNYYYKGTDYPYDFTSSTNACSSYYGYTPINCNYSKYGITSLIYRNMIANVRWNNTPFTSFGTADTTYANDIITTTSTNGYVGLMYASDFGYGPLASVCARTISLGNYDDSTNTPKCDGQNWLFGQSDEYTISQYDSGSAWSISDSGQIIGRNLIVFVYFGFAVRPSLFLSSSVYVLDGDGSYNDPYIIAM